MTRSCQCQNGVLQDPDWELVPMNCQSYFVGCAGLALSLPLPPFRCSDMPDNDDRDSAQRPAPCSREARARNNWFSRAKDFVFNKSRINDVGHNMNANTSKHHITAHTQVNHFYQGIQSTSYVEQAEARGRTDNHWWSYCLYVLLSLIRTSSTT